MIEDHKYKCVLFDSHHLGWFSDVGVVPILDLIKVGGVVGEEHRSKAKYEERVPGEGFQFNLSIGSVFIKVVGTFI